MENFVPSFVIDVHLGKLARYLRLCGFDSRFSTAFDDGELVEISNNENRILLTCDRQLLENRKVSNGYLVRSQKPGEQLKEVFARFNLKESITPFTRCMECNSPLEQVKKEMIIDLLEPRTREFYNSFSICTSCRHIYWEGSHFEKMKKFVEKIRDSNE
jgi:uncharacterized protein